MKPASHTIIASNRKAYHDYHILEKYEAGIELLGSEIKSLRAGKANLASSHVQIENGEAYLHACDIARYEKAKIASHEPKRRRRLLLHKKEIQMLREETQIAGKAIVPLEILWRNGRVKVLIATAKGKNNPDKRDALKKKAEQRDLAQGLKAGR